MALKEVDYDYVSVDFNGHLSWDQYRKINPQGLMPTLAVGSKYFPQATAILEYLEEQYPEPRLLPSDPMLRAEIRAFAQYIVSEMHSIDVVRVRRFLHNELDVDKDRIARWQAHWANIGFSALERILERRANPSVFCFGDSPGWADLHLIPQMRKAATGFGLESRHYPLLSAIFEKCAILPAFIVAEPSNQPDFDDRVPEPTLRQP